MPQWTQGFIRSIEPASKKDTIDVGDKLNVTLEGASFSPVVLVCPLVGTNRAKDHGVEQQILTYPRKTLPSSSSGGEAFPFYFTETILFDSSRVRAQGPRGSSTQKNSRDF